MRNVYKDSQGTSLHRVGLVVSMSASHTVGRGFGPGRVIPKTIIKMVQTAFLHCTFALGQDFDSAAGLSKRSGRVWNCLWVHALKSSPRINCKSTISYPGPRFLSSATWPSMLKKHYNGLIRVVQVRQKVTSACMSQQLMCYVRRCCGVFMF